ncbi:hypothetical protein A9Q84_15890 [Halobacteriovorax marinus]|uniref:Rad50/SbcC-type AAA domain-containing protein n=1 Tax=Halobacteriovorax marinus TaxID=97084 RepID=A0A1Y5F410_9BACT|nr:hypothetical protein A9Q84_15890 [Halobacteriovorax marinus]
MRLKSIEIENITSLSGKHSIDFEDILKEGELFAITGATGSGKSSILTAISLALYGRNYKKNLDSKDFVTLGTTHANIKLYFSTKGDDYCAQWTLKILKKNGEAIKKPTPQRVITKNEIAVDKNIEEIIGLTFDQFTRSVVLNQGQFSKFLVSNFSERRKILERLYSENELSELNKNLREKINTYNQKINLLNVKLEHALPYTEGEIIEAEQMLPVLEKEKKEISKSIISFDLIYTKLKDIIEFSSKRITFLAKTRENETKIAITNDERNKYTIEHKNKSTEFETFKINYDNKREELNKALVLKNDLGNIQKNLEALISGIASSENIINELSKTISTKLELSIDLDKTKLLLEEENKLSHLEISELELIEEKVISCNSLIENNNIHEENLKTLNLELDEITSTGKSLATEKEKLSLQYSQHAMESLGKEIKISDEAPYEKDLKRIELENLEVNEALTHIKNTLQRSNEVKNEIDSIKHSGLAEKIDTQREKLVNAQSDLEKAQSFFKIKGKEQLLVEMIDHSIQEKSCDLCHQSVDEINLDDIKENLLNHLNSGPDQNELDKLINIEKEISQQIHTDIHLKEKTDGLLIELNKKYLSLTENLKDDEALKEKFKSLNKQREKLAKAQQLSRKLSKEIELISIKMDDLRENYSKKNKNQKSLEKLKIDNETVISDQLKQIFKYTNIEFEKGTLPLLKQNIKQAKDFLEIVKQIEHNRDLLTSIQKQSFDEERKIAENQNTLVAFNDSIKMKSDELLKITEGEDVTLALSNLEAQREEKEVALKEIAKNLSESEMQHARLLTSLESISDQMKSLENSLMSSIGHLNTEAQKENTAQFKNQETNILLSKLVSLKTYPDTIETITALEKGNSDLIIHELEAAKTNLEDHSNEITRNTEKIKLFRSKEKEQGADQDELTKLNTENGRLNNLAEVLGKNKDEFRNFVLGFIEQQLILSTNTELSKICDGRYKLIQKESTHGHDFFIIDSWNGALERKVSTLSGGETFLVSLAMALTLAEMTRGQVDIDCFFIDEGFGSLDRDSIEDAFNALMSVRSRGKQIGIISHIKELTSRIPANIHLNKSAEGQSKIEYIFN